MQQGINLSSWLISQDFLLAVCAAAKTLPSDAWEGFCGASLAAGATSEGRYAGYVILDGNLLKINGGS